ncbi:hypothetical protein [Paenibacillus sp. FSL H8-0332]|uniref:hypothetical protein n=1 Tax=Paenibacillus sp. FSL H8-0332 TaxID=2954742 RepID=UPI0030CC289C
MTQSKIEQLANKKLLPANLFNITAQFGHLLETYPNVPGIQVYMVISKGIQIS